MVNQKGQVVLILILVMTVALGIGISVVQRSLSDVSTASKVEQSSRAFSAAEAGIEKSLTSGGNTTVNLDNQSNASATNDLVPCIPGSSGCNETSGMIQAALEYPLLAKEETATIWLADPNTSLPTCAAGAGGLPPACYGSSTLDVYWGNSSSDKAAVELSFIYYDTTTSQYNSKKWYLDQAAAVRTPVNNFDTNADCSGFTIGSNSYSCKYIIGGTNRGVADPKGSLPAGLILLRARLLYNSTSQRFAVQASSTATCGSACSIPSQVSKLTSTGTSGETQRKVQVFKIDKVVPSYFDYAIFSAGSINK